MFADAVQTKLDARVRLGSGARSEFADKATRGLEFKAKYDSKFAVDARGLVGELKVAK